MNRPTLTDLLANASPAVRSLNPSLFAGEVPQNLGPVSNPKPKRNKASALGGSVQGKAESLQRVVVRFTGYRVAPLDPDNFAGSIKDLLDGLRHASLLHGDEPWRIKLETEQVKVSKRIHERTEIELFYP